MVRYSVGKSSVRCAAAEGTKANDPKVEMAIETVSTNGSDSQKRPSPPVTAAVRAPMVATRRPATSATRPPMKNPRPPIVPPIRLMSTARPVVNPRSLTRRSVEKVSPTVVKALARKATPDEIQKTLANVPVRRDLTGVQVSSASKRGLSVIER